MKFIQSLFITPLLFIIIIQIGCNSEESNPVSPSSKFIGRWKSEVPILVKIKTDFCTSTLEDVAEMDWNVSWVVTETSDKNIVDITMNYTASNHSITNSECTSGTGYVPEPQPLYLKGYVTDNTITIEYLNEEILTMDYVNNSLTGELSYSYCMVYCQELYTDEDDFQVTFY